MFNFNLNPIAKPTKVNMNIFNKIDLGSLADKSCNTEDGGPNVHHQCTFPFIWKGQKHFHCSHSNTPSWENEKCKRLIERHPNIFENDKSGVILKNETDSVITTCYSSHPGNYGW